MRGRENVKIASNTATNFNPGKDSKPEVKDNKELKAKIEKIYFTEFEEGIGSILTESESVFINKYLSKIKLVLSELIQKAQLEDRGIKEFLKAQDERIIDKYYNTKKYFLKIYNEFKKNPKFVDYLTKFRKHCKSCPDVAVHNCNSKLILVRENNEIKYVFCSGCKDVFLSKSLILFCTTCHIDFFSSQVASNDEIDIQPATWENYHCGSTMNEQMLCLKCKDPLYVRLSDNHLFCKKCKFLSDPLKIIWICAFCRKDFQCQAKIYNPMEFRIIKNTIKEALLNKVAAVPTYNKCCVKDKHTVFFHKNTCRGELYLSEMNKKPILVCAKCKSIISLEGFLWSCPICVNVFLDEDRKAQKSQVSTSETLKNGESLNSNKMSKSNTLNNFEEEKDSKNQPQQLYVRKNVTSVAQNNCQAAPRRESNFNRIESAKDIERAKARNHSVYRYSNTGGKNVIEEKPKASNLIQIKEEENEEPCSARPKNVKIIQPEEQFEEARHASIIKESIPGFNVGKIKLGNSPQNANSNKTPEFIKKQPINYSQTATNNEIAGYASRFYEDSEVDSQRGQKKNSIFNSDSKEVLNNSSIKNFVAYSPKKRSDYSDFKRTGLFSNDKPTSKTGKNEQPSMSYGESSKGVSSFDVDGKGDDLQNFNVDEYKIIQSIGEGSFGIIYACENIYNKERYALKKIIVNTEEELELFISEFDLIRKVKHKHILNIYGMSKKVLDFSTRVLYIIMELSVSDWDREIKARYKSNGFYKEQELVTMLKQIVEALAFLQGHGISHRDIKPQNILVFPNQVFKIADFGEAKEVKIAKKQMETLRGTELYMSPILFSALRTSDKNNVEHNPYKSDVFSLGYCILYAATLSFKVLYDIRNVNNQKNILNIIKNYLAKKYSSKLVELIARMVDVSEVMRFDFIELNNYLNMNF
jgi:hypothetical protein